MKICNGNYIKDDELAGKVLLFCILTGTAGYYIIDEDVSFVDNADEADMKVVDTVINEYDTVSMNMLNHVIETTPAYKLIRVKIYMKRYNNDNHTRQIVIDVINKIIESRIVKEG